MLQGIITTTRNKCNPNLSQKAKEIADSLSAPYIPRAETSFDYLFKQFNITQILVVGNNEIFIQTPKGKIFFHENTAGLRTKNGKWKMESSPHSNLEPLLRAAKINQNTSLILDCTLGLSCDSLVLATQLFDTGRIIGLEKNPFLAKLVEIGLKDYKFSSEKLKKAAEKIEVICANHLEFLKNSKDKEYDIIYFDTMFEHSVTQSYGIQLLKTIADCTSLSQEAINEAMRVAKECIIIKGKRGDNYPIKKFDEFYKSGKSIFYGVVEKD